MPNGRTLLKPGQLVTLSHYVAVTPDPNVAIRDRTRRFQHRIFRPPTAYASIRTVSSTSSIQLALCAATTSRYGCSTRPREPSCPSVPCACLTLRSQRKPDLASEPSQHAFCYTEGLQKAAYLTWRRL